MQVNEQLYLGVIKRLHNSKEWFLLHDNAPAHTAGVIVRFRARNK
jgi:hypothetical protein